MGEYWEIDQEDLDYAKGVLDDMLDFGASCKLTYESMEEVCPNCIVNPRTGESTGRFKPGGPAPFDLGEVCPVCDGRGRIKGTASFDIIKMTIDWRPKPWMNIGSGTGAEGDRLIRVPAGAVTTRGYLKDLPKVLRANYAILDIENQFMTNQFKLLGQPWPSGQIVKHRYFGAVWERVGG